MKILQVIPYFTPKRGGDVNICYNISKNMTKLGHKVTIITTDFEYDEEFSNNLKKIGIRVIPFRCLFNFSLFLYSPDMKRWLEKNIQDFDIVHLHDFRSYQNIIASKTACRYGVKCIIQTHGDIKPYFEKTTLKIIFDVVWGKKILNRCIKVLALTITEQTYYLEMGVNKEKIEVIPNGVDFSSFSELPERGQFRKKHGINGSEKIILYLGRIHKSKGIDLLISSFSDLSRERGNIRLILIGPDFGYKNTVLEMIETLKLNSKITFFDYVSQDDKNKAFVDADVFVTPCYFGFPITFLEASACGVPIITTKMGDTLEWIDYNAGMIVDYNIKSLKDSILYILDNEELQKKFGTKGREIVQTQFSWDQIIIKVERVYQECINISHMNRT